MPRGLRMLRLIDKFLPPGDPKGVKIVDIGCGHGHVAHLLKLRGYDASGIDLVDMSLFKSVTPTVTDGGRLPFADGSIDVALLMTMLHHTPDPDAILAEAARVARRVIVVEDVPLGRVHMEVIKHVDSLLNLEFRGHPHTNRDDAGWRAAFSRLGLAVAGTAKHWEYGVMRQVAYDLRACGAETILVGKVPVHWLGKSTAVADVHRALDPIDLDYAATLKVEARRAEYLRSRWLVRTLTGYSGPLPRSAAGVTAWPPGIVGSITHKEGHVAVAIVPATSAKGVGVDAESVTRMKWEFAERVCVGGETVLIERLATETKIDKVHWLTVLFSFKEALFKAHYPLGETMFHFPDAEVTSIEPDARGGKITCRLLVDTSPFTPKGTTVKGRFVWKRHGDEDSFVLATVVTN
jgi:4'-phosphopantetheinyl transferase EntD